MTTDTFDVVEKSIEDLQEALGSGSTTSVELVAAYSARIGRHDGALNSIKAQNPNASREATRLDRERAERGARGPLHGVPVIVKDNYETVGMPTTAGSLLLANFAPNRDAELVTRLRAAGAILLAKANMHEFAYGITTVGSGFGETKNPYDVNRNPGGSSGGTGAAIAASFAAVGMGSDTCGSIRIPSAHNNLVGLRGTQGLSSRRGIVPLSGTQDIGGPLARCVRDLALVLDATAGTDPGDPQTSEASAHIPESYTSGLDPSALHGARVGLLANLLAVDPEDEEVAALIRRAMKEIRELGSTVVDTAIEGLARLSDEPGGGFTVLIADFKQDLGAYLEASDAPLKSLGEIVSSGGVHPALAGILQTSLASDVESEEYRVALGKRVALRVAIERAMDQHSLDALAYPTIRRVAAPLGAEQKGTNCRLSANSGLPAISVPAGFSAGGLPVGLELLGRAWSEQRLLSLAYAYERGTRHRKAPSLPGE